MAGVTAHVLLTGFQAGPVALLADVIEAGAVAVYLVGVRRLARRGREWSPWVSAAFVTGIFTVWLAVGSGLAHYDESTGRSAPVRKEPLGESERRTGREDRRASAAAAGSRALAGQLGVQGVPEGWAVPSWRLAELQARQVDHG